MKQSILMLMAYFGRWPEWIEFFMESCKFNADIDWVIFSDCGIPENRPSNVRVVDVTFHEYIRAVEIALDIKMVNPHPYKICDIRPAFGIIHADYVTGYDFFGYGDLDVIYGRIRDFYHEDILLTYDALSTHPERASGHLFVMKNTPAMVRAFQKIPGWQDLLSQQAHIAFDEIHFTQAIRDLCSSHSGPRALFVERYSSPGPAAEMRWFWKSGILSNEFYCFYDEPARRGFLYLHLSDWHSSKSYKYHNHIQPGAGAPWEGLPSIVQLDWRRAETEGFTISPRGITPLEWPAWRGA